MTASLYNQSTHPLPEFREAQVNVLALNIIRDASVGAWDSMVDVSLSSLLFGVLTVLSLTSISVLVRNGSFARANTKVLVLSTIILYLSTGTYVSALVWNRWQAFHLILGAMNGGFSEPSSSHYDGYADMAAFQDAVRRQAWMAVIALEVNCVIGDAIVWWRACVIWRNTVVYCVGPLLVSLTSAFGFLGYHDPQISPTLGVALLNTDNAFVKTALIISLATNTLATALIAYKAWEHSQLVKKHFASAGTRSRVLNALALLVESGSAYCALLIFIVFYEVDPAPSQARAARVFARVAACFLYGCIAPLIAIYPTIIIVLVAFKRSPIDTGGLSRVHQACGDDDDNDDAHRGPVEAHKCAANTQATIVFHHSTFCSSAGGADTEGGMEESTRASDLVSGSPSSTCSRSRLSTSGGPELARDCEGFT